MSVSLRDMGGRHGVLGRYRACSSTVPRRNRLFECGFFRMPEDGTCVFAPVAMTMRPGVWS